MTNLFNRKSSVTDRITGETLKSWSLNQSCRDTIELVLICFAIFSTGALSLIITAYIATH